ncbi:MAG: helix-turn-helix transcriptional regulator [Synergistaceae bacterium]|nr:helix-turn-helix transcriptional regulator [Synergistaceae bacterium]
MVAEKVKTLREARGWTQAELARRLGLTRNGVNSWEQGLSTPSPASLVDLAVNANI